MTNDNDKWDVDNETDDEDEGKSVHIFHKKRKSSHIRPHDDDSEEGNQVENE